jgi:hypothetical protein
MRRHSLPICIFAIACGLAAHAAPAWAAGETWVSGSGTDTGNCNITAPCRTFAYAHGFTTGGGTLNVLSSGNFGPLTITKSISIVAQGVEAVISAAAGGAAIKVVGSADKIVSLRGLTIDLLGTNNIGISFVAGAALRVHNCEIRRSSEGIRFAPASGTSELYVADSVVADTSFMGIMVEPTGSASVKAVLDRVRAENVSFAGVGFSGTQSTGTVRGTLRESVLAGNGAYGIFAQDDGGTTHVMIDRSALVNNDFAMSATGGATINFGDSTVSGNNTITFVSTAALINSFGTNKILGNVSEVATFGGVTMR